GRSRWPSTTWPSDDGVSLAGARAMRRRLQRLVIGLAAVLLLVVVRTAPAAKDRLVIGMPTDVPIFDTHKATGLHNGSILNQVSEPLVGLSPKGEVIPYLVESWEQSKDGRSWTLRLRKGIRFTDGTPVNAEAIRFSIERFRKHSIGKATLAIVESVDVVDDATLRITTKAPYAPLIATL